MVSFAPGHEPWSNLPEEPEAHLRELRCRLREWRKMPHDFSGVTATLRETIRDLLKEHPQLRKERAGPARKGGRRRQKRIVIGQRKRGLQRGTSLGLPKKTDGRACQTSRQS